MAGKAYEKAILLMNLKVDPGIQQAESIDDY